MAEPITFTCGGTPRAAWPYTNTGNVTVLPERQADDVARSP